MDIKASIKFDNHTDEAVKNIGKNISVAVEKSLIVMDKNIKINTPVKHGTLKRSINYRMKNNLEGEVSTASFVDGKEVNYAVYLEYGTRHMAPRAMFRKGVAQSETDIDKIFSDELNKKVV